MLHPVRHLQIDSSLELTVLTSDRKTWRPSLVLPRALCVFESMPCAGLAWYEYRQFASTQARRLAPFRNFGCNAAVVDKQLMLWFWNEDEVVACLRKSGLGAEQLRRIVEPLLRSPSQQASAQELRPRESTKPALSLNSTQSYSLQCWGGVDQLELRGKAIISSRWQGDKESTAAQKPQAPPILGKPWARELLGLGSTQILSWGRLEWLRNRRLLVPLVSAILVAGTAAYAAYWGGLFLGGQQRLQSLEQTAEAADLAIGDLVSLRQSAATDESWVSNYKRLASSVQFDRLLADLARLLEQQGLVIRELELRKGEVRLVVVSAGGDINLPQLLDALNGIAGLSDVQLRDNVELTQAGFSFRVPGYAGLLSPAGDAP